MTRSDILLDTKDTLKEMDDTKLSPKAKNHVEEMTGLDIFLNAFNEHWFKFQHPDRVKSCWVKVVDVNRVHADIGAHTIVIFVYGNDKIGPSKRPLNHIKRMLNATGNLSYHKLFKNCTVVEDKDKLEELMFIEAKLRLL